MRKLWQINFYIFLILLCFSLLLSFSRFSYASIFEKIKQVITSNSTNKKDTSSEEIKKETLLTNTTQIDSSQASLSIPLEFQDHPIIKQCSPLRKNLSSVLPEGAKSILGTFLLKFPQNFFQNFTQSKNATVHSYELLGFLKKEPIIPEHTEKIWGKLYLRQLSDYIVDSKSEQRLYNEILKFYKPIYELLRILNVPKNVLDEIKIFIYDDQTDNYNAFAMPDYKVLISKALIQKVITPEIIEPSQIEESKQRISKKSKREDKSETKKETKTIKNKKETKNIKKKHQTQQQDNPTSMTTSESPLFSIDEQKKVFFQFVLAHEIIHILKRHNILKIQVMLANGLEDESSAVIKMIKKILKDDINPTQVDNTPILFKYLEDLDYYLELANRKRLTDIDQTLIRTEQEADLCALGLILILHKDRDFVKSALLYGFDKLFPKVNTISIETNTKDLKENIKYVKILKNLNVFIENYFRLEGDYHLKTEERKNLLLKNL